MGGTIRGTIRRIVGAVATVLMAGATIAAAPPAAAGCQYGGPVISKCDGPIQPDGTWQRCVVSKNLVLNGASSFLVPERRCDTVGPGQPLADPPTRIDD
ncbi:hypothetical protein VT930_00985 [Mycobacterium sherrisii]|uniref:CDGP domain-containing protein n=1 Tax=Mycobacterium sherrisii TaxID=243061 RepID=A0A1E3SYL4_9MYCO|nr:hypothetical protein [Mycobacterium sherrisii]MEC4761693.1 hypothetical protein [Mycobacterium sherrisii]ODR07237.1 hypothetical protein BHQ21_09250 [Mycobacterium sherrisii]